MSDDIERQWKEWNKKDHNVPTVSDEELREALIKDLTVVSNMTVEEYTLYQKWCEIREKYPVKLVATVNGYEYQLKKSKDALTISPQEDRIADIKNRIWVPDELDDYMKLEPKLVFTGGDPELSERWNDIRVFSSTMKNNHNIGRNLNFIVMDNVTEKYLGVICISSDFLDLTPRDRYIGWSRELKTQGRMINHSAIGSTIVPMQPLGFNYVGGKLLALMCLDDLIQAKWKELYCDILVSVTTTSLYSSFSQYQNLKYWRKRGHSAGSVSYEPTKNTIRMLRNWLIKNEPRKYFEWYIAKNPQGQPYKRDHKNRSNTFVYNKLNIPKELIKSDHQRGIYFSTLYDNSCAFLRKEISEADLKKSFDTSTEALVDIWKNKYASKRIRSLQEKDRVNLETLFYDDLIYCDTFNEVKELYIHQVGR